MSDLFSKVGIDLGVVVLLSDCTDYRDDDYDGQHVAASEQTEPEVQKLYEGKRRPVTRKAVSSAVQGN